MSDIHSKGLSDIQRQIQICRIRMYKLWSKKGYFDSEVLEASTKMDKLVNQYYSKNNA